MAGAIASLPPAANIIKWLKGLEHIHILILKHRCLGLENFETDFHMENPSQNKFEKKENFGGKLR